MKLLEHSRRPQAALHHANPRLTMRSAVIILVTLAVGPGAHADVIRYSCGKTMLSIDTAKLSVLQRFANGFSETFTNGTTTSSYKFTDGSENPYVSTKTVTIDDKMIRFSNAYKGSSGEITIENVIDRRTLVWHHVQSGKAGDTPCSRL